MIQLVGVCHPRPRPRLGFRTPCAINSLRISILDKDTFIDQAPLIAPIAGFQQVGCQWGDQQAAGPVAKLYSL